MKKGAEAKKREEKYRTHTERTPTRRMQNLEKYLQRIGEPSLLQESPQADYDTLVRIMEGHSRSIPFENLDIVMKRTISIQPSDVEAKLVDAQRGGYCWEQNNLLQMGLEALGYDATPLMCRVRWQRPDDSIEPNTTFGHLALKVKTIGGSSYLADVGFGGKNSIRPVDLEVGSDPQELHEGAFRVVPSKHPNFHVLELFINDQEWTPLYEWRDEKAPFVDQECSNWYCQTYPTDRFTTQLFICHIIGDEQHHILNDSYVIRKGHGVNKQTTIKQISNKAMLLDLIGGVFGIMLDKDEGIDRYLR